jgi:hypothetical protein
VSYFTLHCGKLVPCSKCHGNRISEIARLRRKWVFFTVRFVTVTPVTHKPSLAPASLPGLLSYWPLLVAREAQAIFFRRRHQPRMPPLAKINPGSPAPTMGPAQRQE